MQVQVQYFAMLRVAAGVPNETWSIEPGETAEMLYDRILARHSMPVPFTDLRVAVNDEFTTSDCVLTADDRIVFVPPVSGG